MSIDQNRAEFEALSAPLCVEHGAVRVTAKRSKRTTCEVRLFVDDLLVHLDSFDLVSARGRDSFAKHATEPYREITRACLVTLAEQVAALPACSDSPATIGHRPALVTQTPPYDSPVALNDVLTATRAQLSQHAVLPPHAAVTLALWVMLTHFLDHVHYFGILHVVSATRESGKTRVLELLHTLAAKSWSVVSPTLSTLFRTTEALKPTIIIDEVDTIGEDKRSEFTAFLNDGVRRGGCIPRAVETQNGGHEVKVFEIYGPKVLGSIGVNMPDATVSRTIRIIMQRASPTELQSLRSFRMDRAEKGWAGLLRSMMARAATDFGPALATKLDGGIDDVPTIPLPDGIDGRQAQIWEPIVALADLAGGEWPALARAACVALVDGVRAADAPDPKTRLLSDVRAYFDEVRHSYVTSDALIKHLTADESRGWQEYHRDKPLTPHALARLLKPFGLKPTLRRSAELPEGRARAWSRAEFEPVWSRYVPHSNTPPSPGSVTSVQSVTERDKHDGAEDRLSHIVADGTLVTLPQTGTAMRDKPAQGTVRAITHDGHVLMLAANDRDLTELPELFARVEACEP